jgi:hypothetical protein
VKVGSNRGTLFVVTKHPAATGVTNEYFHAVGQMIAAEVGSGRLASHRAREEGT